MNQIPRTLSIDDPAACDPGVTGAKAANLARARAAGLPVLPGEVLTTAWHSDDRRAAMDVFASMSRRGSANVVVRSSSTGEDGDASSMAGVFDSVLDVDELSYLDAIDIVVRSAAAAGHHGLVDAPMAILVQPMLKPRWGGVLFSADPVSGRLDRYLIAAAPGGPAELVSGEVDGWTAVLDRHGRIRDVRSARGEPHPPRTALRALAGLAESTAALYGCPQDLEWAIDDDLGVVLLQARPITTVADPRGTVFGPGPLAESFPEPLALLEQELWLEPMRDGLREALRLTGSVPSRSLESSPLVVSVQGIPAVDLRVLGVESPPSGFLGRIDPRPPIRRLRAAWRVGRLRAALPKLSEDIAMRVDAQLLAVPPVEQLADDELLAILRNGRRYLVSLHGYEGLTGMLIPEVGTSTVTGASLALSALAEAGRAGRPIDQVIEEDPVVLALVPPRVGPSRAAADLADVKVATLAVAPPSESDADAVQREALRIRVRWVQELMARSAWEVALRLSDRGVLPTPSDARCLSLGELAHAVHACVPPGDLGDRREPTGRALPSRFRLADGGHAVAAPITERRRRRRSSTSPTGVGAGGGAGRGLVQHVADGVDDGAILVVRHLDPRLAPLIPRLAGLVAETGSPLSHLAILAREHGVPIVVGLVDATTRFVPGQLVSVDGQSGVVEVVPGPLDEVRTLELAA